MERYQSGRTGAVLKTVDLHGSGGSNPSLSAKKKKEALLQLPFFVFILDCLSIAQRYVRASVPVLNNKSIEERLSVNSKRSQNA